MKLLARVTQTFYLEKFYSKNALASNLYGVFNVKVPFW